ncbi:YutD-like domain-containing protein [Cohnella sp. GbtcB17]|uniref:YutD-like domain-containing protein n=1 Tax=Cohnella sp. GbtcB17 TaxID=2824762 RepID=UPI001C30F90F
MIYLTGNNAYSVVRDHKNGWNPEAFRERFSEVLERYDYIVGDWGYSQLRLRGFFREPQPKAPKESVISHLYEYIHEYCNFGCAYFVLEKLDLAAVPEGAGVRLEELPAVAPQAAEQAAGDADDGQEGEPAAQAPAAAISLPSGGMLMRWPLKERPGGRVPGTSPSAVARAVSEGAERRAAAAQTAAASARDEMYGRGSPFDGARQERGGDSRDRKPGGGGYRGGSSGGGYERRTQGGGYNKQEQRQHPRDGGDRATTSGGEGGGYRGGSSSGGAPGGGHRSGGAPGKWPNNKNRRRGPQGGGQPGGPAPGGGHSQQRFSPGGAQQGHSSGKPRHHDGSQRPEHGQRGERPEHGGRPERSDRFDQGPRADRADSRPRPERPSGGAPRSGGEPRTDGGSKPERSSPAGE